MIAKRTIKVTGKCLTTIQLAELYKKFGGYMILRTWDDERIGVNTKTLPIIIRNGLFEVEGITKVVSGYPCDINEYINNKIAFGIGKVSKKKT